MKKILAVILAVALCLSLGATAFAAEDVLLIAPAPKAGVNVSVSISDAGELVLVNAPVYVIDIDGDDIISINDALIAAHVQYHPEGEAGYAYYIGDYGLAMDKLWGVVNGGSYMYYVNDLMPLSLGEAINEGDSLVAYGFADLEGWSDAYTYFDKRTAAATAGETLELTLSTPDWSGNILPVAGAEIYVDGAATGVVTDENGKAAIVFDKVGEYLVSAKSETAVLVPPVCKVKVAPVGVNVSATISNAGELVLVNASVYVTDVDADGALTINDALIIAHDEYYEGEGGYVTYTSDYGLAIDTLWGVTNGGSYGYYVNNASAWSLTDPVAEDDHLVAYTYKDLEGWSDAYTYFDKLTAAATAGETFEITLSNPDWSGNVLPVAGAEIYVDGAATGVVTDENGKAAIILDKVGEYIISAKSETMTLVPPVCEVTVSVAEAEGEASRAFAVEMLYKAADDTLVPGDFAPDFTDADSPEIREAFRWAAFNGIIEGYGNGKAGPADKLTREQLAVILWRYAKKIGVDVSVGENTNILSYNDALEISEWAIPAMQWACGAGVLNDTDGNIRPAGEVTRGEAAAAIAALAG